MANYEQDDPIEEFLKAAQAKKQEITEFLLSLPPERLLEEMRGYDDETITSLCEMALEFEGYEVCAVAQRVKSERGL